MVVAKRTEPVPLTDAFWQEWCDGLLAASPVEVMTIDQVGTFVSCTQLEALPKEKQQSIHEDAMDNLAYAIMRSHGYRLGLNLPVPTALFVATLSGSPGDCVMYAHVLRRYQQLHPEATPLKMADLAEVFPFGFLSKGSMSRYWELQKDASCPLGNYLDMVVGTAAIPMDSPAP